MDEKKKEIRAYHDYYYPPIPTKRTSYWRRNLLYQFYKFWQLNYKIMRIVVKGHS